MSTEMAVQCRLLVSIDHVSVDMSTECPLSFNRYRPVIRPECRSIHLPIYWLTGAFTTDDLYFVTMTLMINIDLNHNIPQRICCGPCVIKRVQLS